MGHLISTIKDVKQYINNYSGGHWGMKDPITVEHRTSNVKRDYLFVNKTQCKHIPCSPSDLIDTCKGLADNVNFYISKEGCINSVLVVAFAETATAIGNIIADCIDSEVYVMQTTRENVENSVEVISFKEEHSHATDQKLLTYNDGSVDINKFDMVLFVDDEISTGKTILNFIDAFEKEFNEKQYAVASICNWMDEDARSVFYDRNIEIFASNFGEIRNREAKLLRSPNVLFRESSDYSSAVLKSDAGTLIHNNCEKELVQPDVFRRSRLGHKPGEDIQKLLERIDEDLKASGAQSVRIVGTEEFMYIPVMVAAGLEELGYEVICHSTTRSPIDVMVDKKTGRPLDSPSTGIMYKASLRSVYDRNRKTYIYNTVEHTDATVIITDADMDYELKNEYYDLFVQTTDELMLFNLK